MKNNTDLTILDLDEEKKWEKEDRLEVIGTIRFEVIEVHRDKKGKLIKLVVSSPVIVDELFPYKRIEKRISKRK